MILLGTLAVLAIYAVSLPFVMGQVGKQIAAEHGHSFRPVTPLPVFVGTGGRECTVATRSDTFSATDRIRLVGDAVPGAEAVTITVFSVPLLESVPGYPAVRVFASTARCASEDLPPLAMGHYEASMIFGDPASQDGLITFEVVAPR